MNHVRALLLGSVLLFACAPGAAAPSSKPSDVASTAPDAASLTACERESLQAAGDFVGRFNTRDLGGLTSLFTVDARTLWVRRGEPVTSDGFKESGREMIGRMLQTRISDGEVLAYERIDQDPSPRMQYAEGTGQLFASPRFVGARGTFPDGVVRLLSTKFVYACGQHGIVQLVIAPSG
jgi:hypothetical protein